MSIMPPQYTQVPNELLDHLSDYSKAEVDILMVLCRLTFGYHRTQATASNAQLARMSGLAVSTVIKNAKGLEDRGIIRHEVGSTNISVWEIVLSEDPADPSAATGEVAPVAKPTVKKVKPAKIYTPGQESLYNKALALADVCHMDLQSNKGKLLGTAKRLPISAMEIRDLFGPGGTWFRLDFRGKKGSPPMLSQVGSEFKKLRELEQGGLETDRPANVVVKNGELFV